MGLHPPPPQLDAVDPLVLLLGDCGPSFHVSLRRLWWVVVFSGPQRREAEPLPHPMAALM